MDLNNFQELAGETAVYDGRGSLRGLAYTVMGLAAETGELANHGKKVLRGDDANCESGERDAFGSLSMARRNEMQQELGDVLWYVAAVASELRIPLERIARGNLGKLAARRLAGTLKGDTDEAGRRSSAA